MKLNCGLFVTFVTILLARCTANPFGKITHSLKPQKGTIANAFSFEITEKELLLRPINRAGEFFSLPLKEAFLAAAKAESEVGYRMASFTMKEKILASCQQQELVDLKTFSQELQLVGRLSGNGCETNFRVIFTAEADGTIALKVTFDNPTLNRTYLRFSSTPKEKFLGLGEQFSHKNMKGHRVPILTEEQGVGRGAQPITLGANLMAGAGGNAYTTYAPIPWVMSSQKKGLHLLNSAYSVFDFTAEESWFIELWDNQLQARLYAEKDYAALLKSFTAHTGRFPILPDWAYGTILGMQGGKEKVEEFLAEALKRGNPVTAIWIQDWVGRRQTSFGSQLWWRWLPDETSYPNFKQWTQDLRRRGIRVLGYINPFLATEGPMYEEAVAKNLLVKKQNDEVYIIQTAGFPAVLLDLTNPNAVRWLKDIIKRNLLGNGLSGWMADFGEWLPFDAKLYSGEDAALYHNRYPVEWARLNREAVREAGKEGDVFIFVRAGFSESAKYAIAFWLGDQMVTFDEHDGLASAITGLLTGGLSGIAINHSDIGGYTTINNPIKNYHRSYELFQRWVEFEALTPLYRTHEGNRPKENHQFYTSNESQGFFAVYGKLHYELRDYFKELVAEAHQTGMPPVRSLVLAYPDDENSYEAKHQFLVGEDMLVIPVVESGADSVKGYFPSGGWQHALDPRVRITQPGYFKIKAPLGKPAVFLREGGRHTAKLQKIFKEYITWFDAAFPDTTKERK